MSMQLNWQAVQTWINIERHLSNGRYSAVYVFIDRTFECLNHNIFMLAKAALRLSGTFKCMHSLAITMFDVYLS